MKGKAKEASARRNFPQTLPGVPNVPGVGEEGQRPAQSSPRSDSTVYPVLTDHTAEN